MKAYVIRKYTFGLVLAALVLLCIIWPIPRVIGLRNVMTGFVTLLLLVLCGPQIWRLDGVPKKPLLIISTLTIWIVLGISLWGERPSLSYREFVGHWALPLLLGFIGLKVASIAKDFSCSPERLATTIAFGLLFGIVLHNIFVLLYWLHFGQIPLRQAPTMYLPDMYYALKDGKSIFSAFNGSTLQQLSYTNNILAALLVAEVVQRIVLKRGFLKFNGLQLAFSMLMVVFCSYTVGVRNGNVGLVALISFSTAFVLMKIWSKCAKKYLVSFLLIALVLIGSFVALAYKSDARWQRVIETVPLAWDSRTGSQWINRTTESYPTLKDGGAVEGSTYERIGFIRDGLEFIAANPFGTGFHRNAFGYGVDKKYNLDGAKPGMHAHSGVIDFAIANGIIGFLLWLIFLWCLFSTGWRALRVNKWDNSKSIASALMLIFIVSGFATRSLVDSVFQGYEFEQFMFLSSLFYVLTLQTMLVKEA